MRNINYLNIVEIDEFNLIKNSKKIATRNAIDLISGQVQLNYNNYLNNFQNIQNIGHSRFTNDESTNLRSCYKKTVARDHLLKRIIDHQTVHFKHTCPYCLLNNRSTYDHYVPKEDYPVFCVLVNNLIPCCNTCNSKKLDFWRENGARKILHFYNDIIPETQFLFGTLDFYDNIPFIQYELNQSFPISDELFSIIQKHFERLELFDRYQKSLDLVISDIVDDVNNNRIQFGADMDTDIISRSILLKATTLQTHYGVNYWKSVAMNLLANSPRFLNIL